MTALFLKLLNMSIVASWVILAVLVLRLLFKKAPKWINCVLWAVVGIRLIVPVSIESMFSLLPTAEPIPDELFEQSELAETVSKEHGGISFISQDDHPIYFVSEDETAEQSTTVPETSAEISEPPSVIVGTESEHNTENTSNGKNQRLLILVSTVWLAGVICMSAYAVYSYLRIYVKVRSSVLVDKKAYINDEIDTPFILGLLRPRIYMPSVLSEEEAKHVLSHEQSHLKRLDHIWKPLGYAVLTVYWFNPLIWLAYYLLCKDIEFACDERVIKKLNASEKIMYTTTLLQCSVPRKMIAACPLAFGEIRVKERVKTVLHYKKPTFWIIIIAVVICIIFAVAFLTDPKEQTDTASGSTDMLSSEDSTESVLQNASSEESKELSNVEENSDRSDNTEESSKPEESSRPEESSEPEESIPVPPDGEVNCNFNSFEVHFDDFYGERMKQAASIAGCVFVDQREEGVLSTSTIKFENYQQLVTFAENIKPDPNSYEAKYYHIGETLDKYNEEYFRKNDLIIFYTTESSGGNHNYLQKVVRTGNTLTISILKTSGDTTDTKNMFNCLEFPKKEITYCTNFVIQTTLSYHSSAETSDQQHVILSDDELSVYLRYNGKQLNTDTFLLCLKSAYDVKELIKQLGESSQLASALALYDNAFFAKNSLYLFYTQQATAEDELKVPSYMSVYKYMDTNFDSIGAELSISITYRKNLSASSEPVPHLLMFGIEEQGWSKASYRINTLEFRPVSYTYDVVDLGEKTKVTTELRDLLKELSLIHDGSWHTAIQFTSADELKLFIDRFSSELGFPSSLFDQWLAYDKSYFSKNTIYIVCRTCEQDDYLTEVRSVEIVDGVLLIDSLESYPNGYAKNGYDCSYLIVVEVPNNEIADCESFKSNSNYFR